MDVDDFSGFILNNTFLGEQALISKECVFFPHSLLFSLQTSLIFIELQETTRGYWLSVVLWQL